MALVGICVLHAPTTTSPFFSSAGQIMSLLLVTTGATSALLVNRGLSAPTFVSLCNYLMLGAYVCRERAGYPSCLWLCEERLSLFCSHQWYHTEKNMHSLIHSDLLRPFSLVRGSARQGEGGRCFINVGIARCLGLFSFMCMPQTCAHIRSQLRLRVRARTQTERERERDNEHARSRASVGAE